MVPPHRTSLPGRVALVSVHGDPLAEIGSEGAGGQNVYVREVARGVARSGILVDVYTRKRGGGRAEVVAHQGVRVIRLPCGPEGFVSREVLFPHLEEFVHQVLDRQQQQGACYEALHTHYWLSGWVGLMLARSWQIPQIHTHHSLGAAKLAVERRRRPGQSRRLAIERELIKTCTVIATTPHEAAFIQRCYGEPRDVRVIPCGFDEQVFCSQDRIEARLQLGVPPQAPLLLFAGRLDRNKGLEVLLRALAASPEPADLVIAAGWEPEGPDHAEYRRLQQVIDELGLGPRVRFLGRLSSDRLSLAYCAADLSVVPSYYESFGLVALESLACGTPVVASDVGGLPYTVRDGSTGRLVPPQDVNALARAIEELLRDPARRRELGARGQRMAHREFGWSRVSQQLVALYAELTQRTARSAHA